MSVPLSMYQASVPAFTQMPNNLSAILDKAEAYAKNREIDKKSCSITGLPLTCFRSFIRSRLQPIKLSEPLRDLRGWKCQNTTTLKRHSPISRHGSLRQLRSCNPHDPRTLTARSIVST